MDIQGDCGRTEFISQRERHLSGRSYESLESFLPGEIQKNVGKRNIIFDDEHGSILVFDRVAIIEDRGCLVAIRAKDVRVNALSGSPGRLYFRDGFRSLRADRTNTAAGRHVIARQVQRESAAFARHTVDANFAAEQTGNLATDRQAQAGAT